jgi:hypothetical protein
MSKWHERVKKGLIGVFPQNWGKEFVGNVLKQLWMLCRSGEPKTAKESVYISVERNNIADHPPSIPHLLAWGCEKKFAHHSSPSPSYSPHHCVFTPVEPGYGADLFEDDLSVSPPYSRSKDRSCIEAPFAYLGNTPQLDYSIK